MAATTSPPSDSSAFGRRSDELGRRTGALTPGSRSSLRTGAASTALLAPAVIALSTHQQPWGITLLAIAVGGLGLVLAGVAVIELLPTPGRLVFHEHGFADIRRDHATDLYLDGTTVVHTVPSENLPHSARTMGTSPTSSIATR